MTALDAVSAWLADAQRYTCRRAVESAARKHGATRGALFRAVLARRLVEVDTHPDGTALSRESARKKIDTWAKLGPRKGDNR